MEKKEPTSFTLPVRVDLDTMASTMSSPLARKKCQKTGWLRKQGGMVRSWHRRWFILNGDVLFYFAKEDDAKPLGIIHLPGNRIIEHAFRPDEPEKFLFEILPGKGHTRMTPGHESYLICASSDAERQDWIKHIRRVMFRDVGGAIFGQNIEETMQYEKKAYPGRTIPYIIEACVEFLTEHGLDTEGIFRLPGRTSLIRELKEEFDCGERVKLNPETHDVHTVASLLKLYLRQLPESIIPNNFYQKFMNVALRHLDKKEGDPIADLQKNLSLLPEDNYNILEYLCRFVHKVGLSEAVNKMGETNLATVFGPNIIRHLDDNPELFMATADLTHQLTYLLVHNHDKVFTTDHSSTEPSVPVDDLLGIGDEQAISDPPLLPSSDILNAVTTKLGINFDQTSEKSESSVDSGLEVRSSSVREKKLPELARRPLQRYQAKSLSLPTRPVPPARKSKMQKKPVIPTADADADGVTEPSSPEGTPTTPDKWFDPVASPTSWNGPAQNRGHVVYSEGPSSEVVVTNSSNGPLVYSPTEALQQQNDILKETLSRTKSKYESQHKSLMEDRDHMKQRYDQYISGVEERYLRQIEELQSQIELLRKENSKSDICKSLSSPVSLESSKLEPSISEIHLNMAALKDELSKTKAKSDTHIRALKEELTNMKAKYERHIEDLQTHHKIQLEELQRQLDAEKRGGGEAVSRIMSLQAQLHRYHMTYGELPSSDSTAS